MFCLPKTAWPPDFKKQPTYRVVVADQRAPRDGRIVENLGFFNPRKVGS